MRPDLMLFGFCRFRVSCEEATVLFEWWRTRAFSPKNLIRDEKRGEIRFCCSLFAARRLLATQPAEITTLEVIEKGGLPLLFRGLLCRPGLFCGVVIGLLLLIASHLFVWDVRVEGNATIEREELLQEIAAAGLPKGSFLPLVRGDDISAALRRGDNRIAYATVNVQGTVAYVQIRESETPDDGKTLRPANLVARVDGTVILPLVFEGVVLVKEGDVVRAGQILAGGILDTDNHGYRITRAAGQVLARTTHTYTVTVPFSYTEKVYTGRKMSEVSVLFFDIQQKVFKNTGKTMEECDIIEKTQWCSLGGVDLPFGFSKAEWLEYTLQPATRNAREAHALALAKLEAALAADSKGRTILSRTTETVADADGITLICTVICEEDIAMTVEIATD